MRLVNISIENFLSIKSADLDFPNGIISVTGVNKDVAGSNSNGSGKSALFDAISFALYGKTLRPIDKDSIVRRGADQCMVTLFFDIGENTYSICRQTGKVTHVELMVSESGKEPLDLTGSTMTITQDKINAILGMDHKTFLAVATFDLDILRFARATDSEQKQILERILDLEIYGKGLEKVRKEIATKEQGLSVTQENKKFLVSQLDSLLKEEAEVESWKAQHINNIEFQKQEKLSTIESFKKINLDLDVIIKKAKEELDSVQKKLAVQIPKSKVLDELTKQNSLVSKLSWEFANLQRDIKARETTIEMINSRIGQPCKECGRPIEEGQVCHVLESNAEVLLKLMDDAELLDKKITEENIKANTLNQEYQNEQNEQMAVNKVRSEASSRIALLNNTIRQSDLAQRENEKKIIQLDMDLRSLESKGQGFDEQLSKIRTKIGVLKGQIQEKDTSIEILQDGLAYLKYWEVGFGLKGIRSVLLDDVCVMLTENANKYLQHLMGGTLWINCQTQSMLKSGERRERFEIQTFNQYGAGTYFGNSKGEQQRIDIAIALAIQNIAKSRNKNPLGFAIYDEVFERLDSAGCDMIMSLLHKERFNLGTIFIVSNNPNLTVNLKQIEFVKQNGITTCTKQEQSSKLTEQVSQLPPSQKDIPVTGTPSKKIGRPKKKATSLLA